jgi:phage-related tail protein
MICTLTRTSHGAGVRSPSVTGRAVCSRIRKGGALVAIMLPDSLATVLNLVGIPWPNIDEDELRHCAGDLRDFASSLTDSVKDTSGVVSDTSGQTDAAFAKAFAAQWEGRPGEITVISDGADVLAVALEVIAGSVEAAKDAVLLALGALATALLAGGPADLLVGGFEVEIAERVIKAALDVLEQQVLGQLINAAIQPLTDQIPATVRNSWPAAPKEHRPPQL